MSAPSPKGPGFLTSQAGRGEVNRKRYRHLRRFEGQWRATGESQNNWRERYHTLPSHNNIVTCIARGVYVASRKREHPVRHNRTVDQICFKGPKLLQ
ncbi:hypothetical protein TWF173_008957 [Orbilia oligospora]|uniref:Uncharacterized protein n=1 Tax=Orbilia oligospora TaxID=2813651 RepID=A0A7C8RK33_ORBOL|nr:hypothetical protein TWF970_000931 [Orbilia oligospora]KAF3318222.1 hypothetical protein TWF173_008957 [Orbilia oligospora]